MIEPNAKIAASHLKRDAYLYIRQSTVRQVFENQESTKRQYALKQRAIALGWPVERVIVIDSDLGQSGASSVDREGFQRLVAEVGMGRAGIVLGLEVSRLARNSTDWHRLLEICALSETLILDEDGIYNPCDFNDRLLLGLKGTMSEAELHVLRARLRGGILNKARRGELRIALPVGFVYNAQGGIALDPDAQVQKALRHFFASFRRTGTARATVKALREERVLMPRRIRFGPRKGEVVFGELCHWRALQLLHNPRYAGAFVYGRHHARMLADGKKRLDVLPREQWHTLLHDSHEGYISWEEYEGNQTQLLQHAQAHGADRRRSPPREGPSLLQGLVLCGKCGRRMTVRYHHRFGALQPTYVCQRDGIDRGTRICEDVPGAAIDRVIGELVMSMMNPVALEVALRVQQELVDRIQEADQIREQQVARARYEADLARHRFMQVDPNNRLVADALEADWNDKLRALSASQEERDRKRATDAMVIDDARRAEILSLAKDFPKLWRNPKTSMRDRKRMLRLLVEDVTILRTKDIQVHVRFRGGTSSSLVVPGPKCAWELRQTAPDVVRAVDDLLEHHSDHEIAKILNERGHRPGMGSVFNARMVQHVRIKYKLKTRQQRLRNGGMLTTPQISRALGVSIATVKVWRTRGLLHGVRYNDRGEWLYPKPGKDAPRKLQGRKLADRAVPAKILTNRSKEV